MNVHFKPITLEDIDHFEAKFSDRDGASTYQWFGFTNYNALREIYNDRGGLNGDENTLSIFCGEELVGRIDYFKNIGVENPPVLVGKSR